MPYRNTGRSAPGFRAVYKSTKDYTMRRNSVLGVEGWMRRRRVTARRTPFSNLASKTQKMGIENNTNMCSRLLLVPVS